MDIGSHVITTEYFSSCFKYTKLFIIKCQKAMFKSINIILLQALTEAAVNE